MILILKSGNDSYSEMKEGIASMREELIAQSQGGEPFTYGELAPDHPAREYARQVSGRDPADVFGQE